MSSTSAGLMPKNGSVAEPGFSFVAPGSGVMFNNRGFSFNFEQGHPNCIAPGRRPMNTIIPGMLMRDGEAVAPFGVMGGHYQVMGHVELLTGIIDRGLDVQEALDVPRSFGHDDVLDLEQSISPVIEVLLTVERISAFREALSVPDEDGEPEEIDATG